MTIWVDRLNDDPAAFKLHSEGEFKSSVFTFSVELIFYKIEEYEREIITFSLA